MVNCPLDSAASRTVTMGTAEGVQRGLPHFAAAREEEVELLAVLGRLEQADFDGLLVGPRAGPPNRGRCSPATFSTR